MKPLLTVFLALSLCAPVLADVAPPPVYLSHFYVALDQATYDALRKSPEIAALAGIEERHTVAGSRSWSGFYIYGRETYMEFFAVDTAPEAPIPEDCGLGLAVERAGSLGAVAARLRTVFGDKVEIDKQVRTISTGDIPWYVAAAVDAGGPAALQTWVMEVDPAYLSAMHPGSPVRHPLSRQQYLSWNFIPDHLLEAVVGIRAALNSVEMTRLATELELIGWSVQRKDGGFSARGPGAKLDIAPAHSRVGIQQVELRLRRSVPKRTIGLGTATLLLEGTSGRLIFWRSE